MVVCVWTYFHVDALPKQGLIVTSFALFFSSLELWQRNCCMLRFVIMMIKLSMIVVVVLLGIPYVQENFQYVLLGD